MIRSKVTFFIVFLFLLALTQIIPSGAGAASPKVVDDSYCEDIFSEILDGNGAEFDDCYPVIRDSGCEQSSSPGGFRPVNLVMILDSSGSMAAKVQGQTRMAVAQQAAAVFLQGLQKDLQLALMLYGHKGSNKAKDKDVSCNGIETLVPLQKLNPPELIEVIGGLRPTGYTPIGGSLAIAEAMLAQYPSDKYRNIVILISDGKETCGGDPVGQALSLNKGASHTSINVIGLDVGGEVEKQLQGISEAGEGTYYSARTVGELNTVLANLAKQECAIDKESRALDANLSAELNMMSCKNKLTFEKDAMLLEIGFMDDKSCLQYSYDRYRKRYFSIKNRLRNIYLHGRAEIEKTFDDSDMVSEYADFFGDSDSGFPQFSEIAQ